MGRGGNPSRRRRRRALRSCGGRDYIVGEVAGTRLISTVEILDRFDRSRLTVRLECLTAAGALESEPSGPG